MTLNVFEKDSNSIEPFYVVWCDADNTNDGSSSDTGALQGETISTSAWIVAAGITKDSDNKDAVTIAGIVYAVDTVATIWLSEGDPGTDYLLTSRIITSGARTLDHSILIRVRDQ